MLTLLFYEPDPNGHHYPYLARMCRVFLILRSRSFWRPPPRVPPRLNTGSI